MALLQIENCAVSPCNNHICLFKIRTIHFLQLHSKLMRNTGFNFHIVKVYTANLFSISIFGNSFCDIRCNYNIFRNNGFNFNYYWLNLQYYFLIQFYRNVFTIKISISIISESWLPYWFQYMSKPLVQYWFSITIFWIFLLKHHYWSNFYKSKYWFNFNSQNNQIHIAILNSTSMLSIPFCNIGIKFNISQSCIYVFQLYLYPVCNIDYAFNIY